MMHSRRSWCLSSSLRNDSNMGINCERVCTGSTSSRVRRCLVPAMVVACVVDLDVQRTQVHLQLDERDAVAVELVEAGEV